MENQDFSTIFGTSRRFEDWLHDKTNPLVYCLLTLDGKEFIRKNSYTVELSQKTNDHDSFTIVVPDDALDAFQGYVMENSKNLLGKEIGITYWRFGESKHYFRGIIGKIRNKKDEGVITGMFLLVYYFVFPSIISSLWKSTHRDIKNVTIKGFVFNKDNKSLRNYTIYIKNYYYGNSADESYQPYESHTVVTDSSGHYSIQLLRSCYIQIDNIKEGSSPSFIDKRINRQ